MYDISKNSKQIISFIILDVEKKDKNNLYGMNKMIRKKKLK